MALILRNGGFQSPDRWLKEPRNNQNVFDIINNLQSAEYRVWYDEGIDPETEWDENIVVYV